MKLWIYLIGIAIAVSLVGGMLLKYNRAIERAVSAETQLEQAVLQIFKQNDSIAKYEEAAKNAKARSAQSLLENQAEINRLKILIASTPSAGVCPAGDAVLEIRKGLQ